MVITMFGICRPCSSCSKAFSSYYQVVMNIIHVGFSSIENVILNNIQLCLHVNLMQGSMTLSTDQIQEFSRAMA